MKNIKQLFFVLILIVVTTTMVACGEDGKHLNTPSIPPSSTVDTLEGNSTPNKTWHEGVIDDWFTTKDPSQINVSDLNHTLFNGTDAFLMVNNNIPFFTKTEVTDKSFETYASLDSLGRCGVSFACIGKDLMPTEDREPIGSVYPSGWKTDGKSNNHQYDFVDGTYIYNRCHLIGFQLTGENANSQNLITGTRYLNINGMLTFENMIADAVREDNIHVMYRVTPVFVGDNLLPEGVLMEGYSVEDKGETIQFCVFAFNVQPGVEFNYATGENWRSNKPPAETTFPSIDTQEYILNTNSKKFHKPNCSSVDKISEHNKKDKKCSREELINEGYTPCGICKP